MVEGGWRADGWVGGGCAEGGWWRVGGVEARAETTGALGVPVASVTIAGSNSVGASVDAVVGMLGSWERARAGR